MGSLKALEPGDLIGTVNEVEQRLEFRFDLLIRSKRRGSRKTGL